MQNNLLMCAFSDKTNANFILASANAELANYQFIWWQKLLEKELFEFGHFEPTRNQ